MHDVLIPKWGRWVCVEVRCIRLTSSAITYNGYSFAAFLLCAGCASSLPDRPPPCPRTDVRFEPESCRSGGLLPAAASFVRRGSRPPLPGGSVILVGPASWRVGSRSPGASWSPALLESVDGWPLATPDTEIPGGSRPVVSAVRRRARGVRSLHPRATCRSQPPPVRATRLEHLRVGLVSRGLVGAIGWSSASSPGAPGLPRRPGASLRPVLVAQLSPPSAGGVGPPDVLAFAPRAGGCPDKLVIWLILPVVICLSQRLSHACLSISNLYCETANGSLNQLSFI